AYCTLMAADCTGSNVQFPGADEATQNVNCINTCFNMPVWSCGSSTDTTGNTLFCRYKQVLEARMSVEAGTSPATYCLGAGPSSTVCR
ncbi:MAG TPA: hypothetical protein VKO16_11720, partial [Polyangia bacterium]|nr:hypothetical protein [Polyangia bacterium]